jgi:hypothetical protein
LIPSKYINHFKGFENVLATIVHSRSLYTLLMDQQTPADSSEPILKVSNHFPPQIPVQDTLLFLLSRILKDEIVFTAKNALDIGKFLGPDIDFRQYKDLQELFYRGFTGPENAHHGHHTKRTITFMTRHMEPDELLSIEMLKNPHINKVIFTSVAHELKLHSLFTAEHKEFMKANNITIISHNEGGLLEYRRLFPHKKIYVEGGDEILHYFVNSEPEDAGVDTFILTARHGNEFEFSEPGQTVGKGVTYSQIVQKAFLKTETSRDIITEDGVYRINTFQNRRLLEDHTEEAAANLRKSIQEAAEEIEKLKHL